MMGAWVAINMICVLIGASIAVLADSLVVKVLGLIAVFSGMLYIGGVA